MEVCAPPHTVELRAGRWECLKGRGALVLCQPWTCVSGIDDVEKSKKSLEGKSF